VSVCRSVGVSGVGVFVCLCVGDQVSKCWTGVMAVAVCMCVLCVLCVVCEHKLHSNMCVPMSVYAAQ
jgi:hypothetical protein